MDRTLVDLQITSDGRYAVAVMGARWIHRGEGYILLPRKYQPRPSQSVLTVIDLDGWRIIKRTDAASIGIDSLGAARILNSGWIAVNGLASGPDLHSVTGLLSLPDFEPGPTCLTEYDRPWGSLEANRLAWRQLNGRNDGSCRGVLNQTGSASFRDLESRIFFARDLEPDAIRLHRYGNSKNIFSPDERANEDIVQFAEPEWRYPFRTEGFRVSMYFGNLPYQSGGRWYGFYASSEPGYDLLGRFDHTGTLQEERPIHSLACGDPSFESRSSACGCRIEDSDDDRRLLLAYCRTQRGDFDGRLQSQWLSVFHSDSLTEVGAVRLAKDHLTAQLLGAGGGRSFVLTVDYGETVRVYAISPPR
jgi:hypothetical protein